MKALKKIQQWLKESPATEEKTYAGIPTSMMMHSYVTEVGNAVWSPRNYEQFASEAYAKNVIAHRSIALIAQAVASVSWVLHYHENGATQEIHGHPLLTLLQQPNPAMSGAELMQAFVSYRYISGNGYLLAVGTENQPVRELYVLRPDRVKVIAGRNALPAAYEYSVDDVVRRYPVHPVTGASSILHSRMFHPLSDWYGLSSIEAAAYSIDQHDQAGQWNQALLQHGAKPSGALVVRTREDGTGGILSDEQYQRIKYQIENEFSGAANAGRPILLEGGLDWKEMSLSPKDMDFIESKHSSARDIALAFGVPPQLLGIPGDNTYSNLVEARIGLWEQTILPLVDSIVNDLNGWLVPYFGKNMVLGYDADKITALAPRRESMWSKVQQSDFMTVNEKRRAVGLDSIPGGDVLNLPQVK